MPTETLDPLGIETGRVDPLGLETAPVETAPPVVAPPVSDWRAAAAAQMRPLGAQVGLPERPSHEEPLETPEEQAKRAALAEETRRAKGSRRLQELDLAAAKGLETGAQILSRMIPTTAIADAARALGIQPPIPKEHVRQVIDAAASLGHQVAQVPDVPGVKPELNQKISEGLKDFASEFISGFSSPEQAALIASGAKSPEVVARLFQIGSIASLPEATEQLKEAVKSGDAKQITKAGAGLGMSLAIPAAIERGLAPKPAPIVPPVTGRALELPPRIEPPSRPPEADRVAPVAPVRPPTATETTPVVPRAEMPTTPTATGVRPAIRLVGGKVVVGDAGKTHPDIISLNKLKATDIDQRGFVNERGEFMDREQTAAATGVPTVAEPARQHSTDLPEAKAAAPQPISKASAGKALRKLVVADRDLAEQLAANHPGDLRLNEDGTRVLADIDPRARGPGTGGTAGMTTDFINWLLTTKGEGIAPDALAEHMADVNRAREIITGKKAPAKPPPTEPTPAKEPWQMTLAEYKQDYLTARGRKDRVAIANHLNIVERALKEGKPVPPEVLADYPELKPAPAPPTPAAPAAVDLAKVEPQPAENAPLETLRAARAKYAEQIQAIETRRAELDAEREGLEKQRSRVYTSKKDYNKLGERIESIRTEREDLHIALQDAKRFLSDVEGNIGLARFRLESAPFLSREARAAVPQGTTRITAKVLKTQKDTLISQVEKAIKDAPEEGTGQIVFDVPGDGVFTITNTKTYLKSFLEKVSDQFPSTIGKPGEPKLPSGRAKNPPKVAMAKSDALPKLIGDTVSSDPARLTIQYAYADGTQIVATDGRQLVRIVTRDAPGTPTNPVRLNAKGKIVSPDTKEGGEAYEGKYPNWKQVYPINPSLVYAGMDTGQLFHILRQAEVFRDTAIPDRSKRAGTAVEILINPDRSLGGRMTIDIGDAAGDSFSHNVQPGAQSIGAYNPDYVLNAMEIARKTGNEKVDILLDGEDGAMIIRGSNMEHITMPVRGAEEAGKPSRFARDNVANMESKAGRPTHRPLPEGLGPLENPESLRSAYREIGGRKFQVSLEGGKLTFDVQRKMSYTDYKGRDVYEYGSMGDPVKLSAWEKIKDLDEFESIVRDRLKTEFGEKSPEVTASKVSALIEGAKEVIAERQKVLDEIESRKSMKLEARAEGFTGKPMAEADIWNQLREKHGIRPGGLFELIDDSGIGANGWLKWIELEGGRRIPTGIVLNRARIPTAAKLDWTVEHETAHWYDLINRNETVSALREHVTAKELDKIQNDVRNVLKYPVNEWRYEDTARGIQALTESWRGRPWFERIVEQVKAFIADKLGIERAPSRIIAERAAVQAIARMLETLREGTPLPADILEGRIPSMEVPGKPPIAKMGGSNRINKLGDPQGTTYHATPEDWAEWQRLLSRPMMEEGIWPAREAMKNKYGGMPPQPPLAEGVLEARGPGAQTKGEPPYPAASQLIDQLRALPVEGARERVSLGKVIAEKWAQGKTALERAIGFAQVASESIKATARGVRTPTDVDRKVGELDWLLQYSAARSKEMGQEIPRQQLNVTKRRAAALWSDTPGTPMEKQVALQDALSKLPEATPEYIRDAIDSASRLRPEDMEFVETLRQYYGLRERDAIEHGIFGEMDKEGNILKGGLDDYFTHVWKRDSNMPEGLRAAINNGRVSEYFQYARQRKIGMLLDGILQGRIPELDPAAVLPHYNYSLDRAIASRQFIKDLTGSVVAEDGRAILAPTGTVKKIGEPGTVPDATLIRPRGRTDNLNGYRAIDHPSMRKWKWVVNDENGNPILSLNDLLVHPDHYERLARFMDRSRLTPTNWGRRALRVSTEVKGFKLGLLSAFHQVHVMSHAVFHWTLPFRFKDPRYFTEDGHINWDSPDVRYAVEKGHLKLAADPRELAIYSEGLAPGYLVQRLPIIGPWSKWYSDLIFGELIPKLKLKTFENALPRNRRWYKGKLTDEEIAARVGNSVNNAYGELNSLFLGKTGRDPRFQRILRGIFLAPDFGEARLGFVEKAFTRYGGEERLALATMFLTLYTGARVANWLSHGDPETDLKNAFSVKVGEHWWSMRSVLGDLVHAITRPGQFFYVRLNPLYSRTAADVLFGRDLSGRKLTPSEIVLKRPAEQLIPIQFGALTRDDQALWESAVTAMGVQARGDSPQQDVRKLSRDWMKSSPDPKLRAEAARREAAVFPPSDYNKIRFALRHNNIRDAQHAYDELRETRSAAVINEAMQPNQPFTGSWANERKFKASLTPAQMKVYEKAKADQKEQYERFKKIKRFDSTPKVTYLDPLGIESGGP